MDQAIKKRRENSVTVTGLASTTTKPDAELFTQLCAAELHVQPDVVSVKRLGRLQSGRVQPLLVYLKQADQTKQLISSIRLLRRSADPCIREKVFINLNMTKAEAEAAYKVRVQRRQMQQLRQRDRGQTLDERDSRTDSHSTVELAAIPSLNPTADQFLPPAAAPLQPTD